VELFPSHEHLDVLFIQDALIVIWFLSALRLTCSVASPSYITEPLVGIRRSSDSVKLLFPEPVRPTIGRG